MIVIVCNEGQLWLRTIQILTHESLQVKANKRTEIVLIGCLVEIIQFWLVATHPIVTWKYDSQFRRDHNLRVHTSQHSKDCCSMADHHVLRASQEWEFYYTCCTSDTPSANPFPLTSSFQQSIPPSCTSDTSAFFNLQN